MLQRSPKMPPLRASLFSNSGIWRCRQGYDPDTPKVVGRYPPGGTSFFRSHSNDKRKFNFVGFQDHREISGYERALWRVFLGHLRV
jgi:hypothetical protein